MRLKRLVVQGFKSFKDRTVIHFDDGITGIVGPNGCGKSNIVDALFWVMGATSAKHLRGKSMKELIFAGSSKYNPAAWAEVSLILENDEGKHIHIGNKVASPSEIQLTRKLYRNGETEYRINNQPARLKDIQEVFMDTGAGAKSYSIIAQGEINRLVQAKPEDRRSMIEDVAGISKFKLRKKESVRKLEQTTENLSRLTDIKNEIEKNLKSLQLQAEKANKAKSLKERIKKYDIVVNAHKVFDALRDHSEQQVKFNEITALLEEWKLVKEQLEVGLESERILKEEKTEQLDDLQKEFNEISRELAASEERFKSITRSKDEKEGLIEHNEKEGIELKSEIAERQEKLADLNKKKTELENFRDEDHDYTEMKDVVDSLKAQVDDLEEEQRELASSVSEKQSTLIELDQEVFKIQSKLEEYAASLHDTGLEIEDLEEQFSGLSNGIKEERDEVFELEKESQFAGEEEIEHKAKIEKDQLEFNDLEKDYKTKSTELIQSETKLESLIAISKSFDGAGAGASEFLKEHEEGHNILGNLIQCDEKYTLALDVLTKDLVNMIASNGEHESFFNWLSSNELSAADYLLDIKPLIGESETFERLVVNGIEGLIKVTDIVKIDDEYKSKLKPLFDGMYICNELTKDTVDKIPACQFKSITSLDGRSQLLNKDNARIFKALGELDPAGSMVERNNQIQILTEKVEILSKEVSEIEALKITKETALKSLIENYEELRNRAVELSKDYIGKKAALDAKLSSFETATGRLDILKKRNAEISSHKLDLLEKEEEFLKKQETLKEESTHVKAISEDLSENLVNLRSTYQSKRDELLQKEADYKSFEQRLEGLDSQIEDVQNTIEKQNSRFESLNERTEQYVEEIEKLSEESLELETQNLDQASELSDREEVLSVMKDEFSELLLAMQEREDNVKDLTSKINKNEKSLVEINSKLLRLIEDEEQYTRNIFERYQIDLRAAIADHLDISTANLTELNDISDMYFNETEFGPQEVDVEEYEFVRRYGQDLKDCGQKYSTSKAELTKLGEINWQAIEDYDRQKLRFDFLSEQEGELKKSVEDLENAITQIDEKSKKRFKMAFEEVSLRFEKVFPIIFGGGSAKLQITGDFEDPECGIEIIAKPPGKKMQNINLMSGGEKAMTAVSLIFSIFLVKPSPFCLLDEVDAPLDDANVGRFNELLREMSDESQFILITHNKKTMEMNDILYGVTMQEPGVSKAVSVQLH